MDGVFAANLRDSYLIPNEIPDCFNWMPNPAVDEAVVSLSPDHFQLLNKPQIHIIDVLGKILASFPLNASQKQLGLSTLPAGLYIVTLESKGQVMTSKKLLNGKWHFPPLQ